MASGDTKTEQMLNVLANGGDASQFSGCCNTKTQNYILGAIDRVQSVEDEVEELKNNPDVVDIVATYADLQAYDTQHLTDKDVIRVLQDETHDGDSTYYRYNKQADTWTYIGESKQYTDFVGTDGTAVGVAGLVPAPATTDAGKFLKADGTWAEAGGGSSGAIELTSADYDYPDANPTGVALWRLPAGMYWTKTGVKTFAGTSFYTSNDSTFIISNSNNNYYTDIIKIYSAGEQNTYTAYKVTKATGAPANSYSNKGFLLSNRIAQTTGQATDNVMSQKAVTDTVDGLTLLRISQTDYDNLQSYNANTLYIITGA